MRPNRRPTQSPIICRPWVSCAVAFSSADEGYIPDTYTDSNLTNHDTDNLEVGDGSDPVHRALAVGRLATPARLPAIRSSKVTAQISDREKHVAFKTETGTRQDRVVPVPAQRAQGVLLHHGADLTQLLLSLGIVDGGDEFNALGQWQVSPVDALRCVAVVRVCDVIEDLALLLGGDAGVRWVAVGLIAGFRPVRHGNLPGGRVVVFFVGEEVRHVGGWWRVGGGNEFGGVGGVSEDAPSWLLFPATLVSVSRRREGFGKKSLSRRWAREASEGELGS